MATKTTTGSVLAGKRTVQVCIRFTPHELELIDERTRTLAELFPEDLGELGLRAGRALCLRAALRAWLARPLKLSTSVPPSLDAVR